MFDQARISTAFTGDVSDLKAKIQEAQDKGEGLKKTFGMVGQAIAGAFSARAIIQFGMEALKTADAVANLSARLNLSAETTQSIDRAAKEAGLTMGDFEAALVKLNRAQADAQTGNKKNAESFAALGISIADLTSLKPEELFERVAKALAENEGNAEATSAAYDLLGRSAGRSVEVIKDIGAEGFAALNQRMKDSGLIMENDVVANLDKVEESLDRAMTSAKTFGASLLGAWADFASKAGEVSVSLFQSREEMEQIAETQRWLAERAAQQAEAEAEKKRMIEEQAQLAAEILKATEEQAKQEKLIGEELLKKQREEKETILKLEKEYNKAVTDLAVFMEKQRFQALSDEEKLEEYKAGLLFYEQELAKLGDAGLKNTTEYQVLLLDIAKNKATILALEQNIAKSAGTAAEKTATLSKGAGDARDVFGKLDKDLAKLNAFEMERLVQNMKRLQQALKDMAAAGGFPDIKLPDLAGFQVPEWMTKGDSAMKVQNIVKALISLSQSLAGKDFSAIAKAFDFTLPDTTKTDMDALVKVLKATEKAKFGSLDIKLDYPEAGVPIDASALKLESISASLATIAGMKGIAWY